MKIESIEINDFNPIKHLKLENLSDIVIIAGANGSGKTRLKEAIVQTLQNPKNPLINMRIKATRKEEKDRYFNGEYIEIKKGVSSIPLNNYINSRKYVSSSYVGSLVQIDSSRNIEILKYQPVNWLAKDPDEQETNVRFYFNPFTNRWSEFMNYIHQKSASRDKKLSDELKKNPGKIGEQILLQHPDPLQKYKDIFARLLPGKTLQDINIVSPKEFYYMEEGNTQELPFGSLSSGEQEVVKVLFDIIRKDIKHSVIIVDEPELHLHPILTFKLVETLKTIGDHTNQFIFLTHSADLISTYYSTGNVYFIDSTKTGANQAHRLSELNHSHGEIIQLIGQNLGLFAVGKKLIFIEGKNSSSDRLTYHSIAQKIIPEAKVIPVGSVSNIVTLNEIEKQIRNSIFGIDIYMIRDRDGLSESQIIEIEQNGKIKCLKKRHIENYFLDSDVLFRVAEKLYLLEKNPNINLVFIETEMKNIAMRTLSFNLLKNTKEYLAINHYFKIPTVKSVESKSITETKSELISNIENNLKDLSDGLSQDIIKKWLDDEEMRLTSLLATNDWKNEFQGKIIFSKLCADVLGGDELQIKRAYVDIALVEKQEIFQDIFDILESFK